MQSLWHETLSWDHPLSTVLLNRWKEIYCRLFHIQHLQIPRWIGLGPDIRYAKLHGFADASNIAYAAVVYLKVVSSTDHVTITSGW